MKKYMNVIVGDTIKAVFGHYHPSATIVGVVKKITERIGGEDLIEVDPITDERPIRISEIPEDVFNTFSVYFVKEIINRPLQKGRPVQRFPKNCILSDFNFLSTIKRGVKAGSFSSLLLSAMKKASIEVIDLDFTKAKNLWKKQKPGLLKTMYDGAFYHVHWKPFQKWVFRNQSKLIKGRRNIKKEVEELDKAYAKQYWEDVDRQLDDDFDILDNLDRGLAEQLDEDYKLY